MTERTNPLTPEQQERAEAVRIASAALSGAPTPINRLPLPTDRTVADLADLAIYIETGEHPLAGYRPTKD